MDVGRNTTINENDADCLNKTQRIKIIGKEGEESERGKKVVDEISATGL